MYPKCVHTQNVALLKSINNIVWYQTLQNANKRRNRTFDVFLLIVSDTHFCHCTPTFSSRGHCTSSRVSKYVIYLVVKK